jgi:hypothetical protein
MAKFYKHTEGNDRSDALSLQAKKNVGNDSTTNQWMAERAILNLREVVRRGLPDCYDDFEDFLHDFWPDLPWNDAGLIAVVTIMLADRRIVAISIGIAQDWGIEMGDELRAGMQEARDHMDADFL